MISAKKDYQNIRSDREISATLEMLELILSKSQPELLKYSKEILDSNELGPIISAVCYMNKNWNYEKRTPQYRSRFHGGGMWITNGIHVVDRLTWIIGWLIEKLFPVLVDVYRKISSGEWYVKTYL